MSVAPKQECESQLCMRDENNQIVDIPRPDTHGLFCAFQTLSPHKSIPDKYPHHPPLHILGLRTSDVLNALGRSDNYRKLLKLQVRRQLKEHLRKRRVRKNTMVSEEFEWHVVHVRTGYFFWLVMPFAMGHGHDERVPEWLTQPPRARVDEY